METTCDSCGKPFSNLQSSGVIHCPECLFNVFLDDDETALPDSLLSQGDLSVEDLIPLFPELEVIEQIGMGGMGRVFLAKQKSLGRKVALKILRFEAESNLIVKERFEREARALAEISHPNIVEIYNFGQRHGLQFLLMEYVDGPSLSGLMKQGPLERQEALQIISQICDGVEHAHQLRILHRDIKPGNILISRDGKVKVADFGLAKSLHSRWEYSLTSDEEGFGTPVYMAPEQLKAAKQVDERADIFSLAVLSYEMLTGRLPAVDEQIVSGVSNLKKLDKAILQGLNPNPDFRPKSVAHFKAALQGGLTRDTFAKPRLRSLTLVLLSLVVVAFGIWLWINRAGHFVRAVGNPTAGGLATQDAVRNIEKKYLLRIPDVPVPTGSLLLWQPENGDVTTNLTPEISTICELGALGHSPSALIGFLADGSVFRMHPPDHAVNSIMLTYGFSVTDENQIVRTPGKQRHYEFKSGPMQGKVRSVYDGRDYAVVLTDEGRVRVAATEAMWEKRWQMFEQIETFKNVVDIENSSSVGILLQSDGNIICWNIQSGLFITQFSERQNWRDVACGFSHFVAVDSEGKVETWSAYPNLKDPRISYATEMPDFGGKEAIRVEASHHFSAAQFTDGTWRGWGIEQEDGLIDKISSIGPARDLCFRVTSKGKIMLFWIGTLP